MRGDQVVHTFAVGSDCGSNPAVVLAHWEMIRRFMEEGRSALPFPPLQLYTSVAPSFRNAFIIHVSSAGSGLMWIALPLTLPWALFRFLAMKLCRKPVWPASIVRRTAASSGTPPLRAPVVYGRVDHVGGRADEMERFWKESIAAAKARNDEVGHQLKERAAERGDEGVRIQGAPRPERALGAFPAGGGSAGAGVHEPWSRGSVD
ncbi:hypothetical protein NMB32_19735 [Stenotrophomonas sp. CD2]|nr:hypothetical protein NMB32_19735 [Stenotrophomonas sp. CD2]